MSNKEIHNWSKEVLLKLLSENARLSDEECSVQTFEGEGSSVVVSMRSEGESPIMVEMNGANVEVEVVLFSLD